MILDDLSREEMKLFESVGVLRDFQKGDMIVTEEETGSSLFLMLTGRAEVRKNVGSLTYRKLDDLGPCGVFGEICFLGSETRSASVVAVENAKVLEFQRAEFEGFAQKYPAIGMKVYRGIAKELAARLVKNNDELRKAIMWALDEMRDRNQLFISTKTLSKLASDQARKTAAGLDSEDDEARTVTGVRPKT